MIKSFSLNQIFNNKPQPIAILIIIIKIQKRSAVEFDFVLFWVRLTCYICRSTLISIPSYRKSLYVNKVQQIWNSNRQVKQIGKYGLAKVLKNLAILIIGF